MVKGIPVFIVLVSLVLPIVLASRAKPKKQLRTLQLTIAALAFLWAILCVYVYPRYVFPE
jgi:hypothetical protein